MKKQIYDEKAILKAAQAVWATNKYFILACNQQDYYNIRQFLKPQQFKLQETYHLLKNLHRQYQMIESADLPQISNALFHMLGYFKKNLPADKRQELNQLIKVNPGKSLLALEHYSYLYDITYLMQSNIWPTQRTKPFNQVSIPITHDNILYSPDELLWMGNHLIIRDKSDKHLNLF